MDPSPSMSSKFATEILNFGKLLWDGQRNGQRNEKKIEEAEEKLIFLLVEEKSQLLRGALNYNNAGKNIEPLVLRSMSLVSYCTLCTPHNAPTVALVACTVAGSDTGRLLETREVLSRLCVKGDLLLATRVGSCLTLGPRMIEYFSGGSLASPVVLTESTIKKAVEKSLRKAAKQPVYRPQMAGQYGTQPLAIAKGSTPSPSPGPEGPPSP